MFGGASGALATAFLHLIAQPLEDAHDSFKAAIGGVVLFDAFIIVLLMPVDYPRMGLVDWAGFDTQMICPFSRTGFCPCIEAMLTGHGRVGIEPSVALTNIKCLVGWLDLAFAELSLERLPDISPEVFKQVGGIREVKHLPGWDSVGGKLKINWRETARRMPEAGRSAKEFACKLLHYGACNGKACPAYYGHLDGGRGFGIV